VGGSALSRSGKKVLHVDRNGFYGGAEAALSLQDAEEWVKLDADPQGQNNFQRLLFEL
jgi:RAB protein geranylgeranyltransferase component A